MFAIRIVTVDYYLTSPVKELDVMYSEFRCTEINQVPVVRIFGSTPAGQKTCLHLHGVFPYIYVPYNSPEPWQRYAYQLSVSLDRSLNMSLGKPSTCTHVYKVTLVDAVPFYGYHSNEKKFLKIYFYNPHIIKRAVELLQNGAVMNSSFQPHEAHVPFILQMFMDSNLYGMNLLYLTNVKFRRKELDNENEQYFSTTSNQNSIFNSNSFVQFWNLRNIPSNLLLPNHIVCQSTCELEVDALASDIIIPESSNELCLNPGLKAIWEDERQRRRDQGDSSQMSCIVSQDRQNICSTKSEIYFKQTLSEIVNKRLTSAGITLPTYATSQPEMTTDRTSDENNLALEPIVNEEITLSLMSNTSSHQNNFPNTLDSQDESLVQFLVNMNGENTTEDLDSILSSQATIHANNDYEELNDDLETLEMSQLIWETDSASVPVCNENLQNVKDETAKSKIGSDFQISQVDGPGDPPLVKKNNIESHPSLNQTRRRLTARKSIHRPVFPNRDVVAYANDSAGSVQQRSDSGSLLFSENISSSACAVSSPNSYSQSCMYRNNTLNSVSMKDLATNSTTCFTTNFVNADKCHDAYNSTWRYSSCCQRDDRNSIAETNPFTDEYYGSVHSHNVHQADYFSHGNNAIAGSWEDYFQSTNYHWKGQSDGRVSANSISAASSSSPSSYSPMHPNSCMMQNANCVPSHHHPETNSYANSWTMQPFTNISSGHCVPSAFFHQEKQMDHLKSNNEFSYLSAVAGQPVEELGTASGSITSNAQTIKNTVVQNAASDTPNNVESLDTSEIHISQDDSTCLRTAVDALNVINDDHLMACDAAAANGMPDILIQKLPSFANDGDSIVINDQSEIIISPDSVCETEVYCETSPCQQQENNVEIVEQNIVCNDVAFISENLDEIDGKRDAVDGESEEKQNVEIEIKDASNLKVNPNTAVASLGPCEDPSKLDVLSIDDSHIPHDSDEKNLKVPHEAVSVQKPEKRLPVLEKMALLINDSSFFPLENDWLVSQMDKNFQQLSLKLSEDENSSPSAIKLENRTEVIRKLRQSRLSLKRRNTSNGSSSDNNSNSSTHKGSDCNENESGSNSSLRKMTLESSKTTDGLFAALKNDAKHEMETRKSKYLIPHHKTCNSEMQQASETEERNSYSRATAKMALCKKRRGLSLRKNFRNYVEPNTSVKFDTRDPLENDGKLADPLLLPQQLHHSIGTNVHPQDFPGFRSREFYTIRFGNLRVNVPRTVKVSHLKKLGKERLKIPKLNVEANNVKSLPDGNNEDEQRWKICQMAVVQKVTKSPSTKETTGRSKQDLKFKAKQKWSLESVSDGLKIRLKSPNAKCKSPNIPTKAITEIPKFDVPNGQTNVRHFSSDTNENNAVRVSYKNIANEMQSEKVQESKDIIGIGKTRSRRPNVVYKQLPTMRRTLKLFSSNNNVSNKANKDKHTKSFLKASSQNQKKASFNPQTEFRPKMVSVEKRHQKWQDKFKDLQLNVNELESDIDQSTKEIRTPQKSVNPVPSSPRHGLSPSAKSKYSELRVVITPLPKNYLHSEKDAKRTDFEEAENSSPNSSDALWDMAFPSPQDERRKTKNTRLSLWSPTCYSDDRNNPASSAQLKCNKKSGKLKLWLKKVQKQGNVERLKDRWSVRRYNLRTHQNDDSIDSDSEHIPLLHRNLDVSEIDNLDSDASLDENPPILELQCCSGVQSKTSVADAKSDEFSLKKTIQFEIDGLSDISLLSETDDEDQKLTNERSSVSEQCPEPEADDMVESLVLSDFSDEETKDHVMQLQDLNEQANSDKNKMPLQDNNSRLDDDELHPTETSVTGDMLTISYQLEKTEINEDETKCSNGSVTIVPNEDDKSINKELLTMSISIPEQKAEETDQQTIPSSFDGSQDLFAQSPSLFSVDAVEENNWEDISNDTNETISKSHIEEDFLSAAVDSCNNQKQFENASQIQPMEYSESLVKLLRKDKEVAVHAETSPATADDADGKSSQDAISEMQCGDEIVLEEVPKEENTPSELPENSPTASAEVLNDKVTVQDSKKRFEFIAAKDEILKKVTDKVAEELASMTYQSASKDIWNADESSKRTLPDANALHTNDRSKSVGITIEETEEAVNSLLNIINSGCDEEEATVNEKCKCAKVNDEKEQTHSVKLKGGDDVDGKRRILSLKQSPPSREMIIQSSYYFGICEKFHQDAYCSKAEDIPERVSDHASQKLRQASQLLQDLQEFKGHFQESGMENWRLILATHFGNQLQGFDPDVMLHLKKTPKVRTVLATNKCGTVLTPNIVPPTRDEVNHWIKNHSVCEKKIIKCRKYQLKNSSDNVGCVDKMAQCQLLKTPTVEEELIARNSRTGVNKRGLSVIEEGNEISNDFGERLESPLLHFADHAEQNITPPIHSTPMTAIDRKYLSPMCTPFNRKLSEMKTTCRYKRKKLNMPDDDLRRSPDLSRSVVCGDFPISPMNDCASYKTSATCSTSSTPVENLLQDLPKPNLQNMSDFDSCGFKISYQNLMDAKITHQHQYLTTFVMEVHAATRGDSKPDPEFDPVLAIFYHIHTDAPPDSAQPLTVTGSIIVDNSLANNCNYCSNEQQKYDSHDERSRVYSGTDKNYEAKCRCWKQKHFMIAKTGISNLDVLRVGNEEELFQHFIRLVQRTDPDILVGYEIQMLSWGYMKQRATFLKIDLVSALSRIPGSPNRSSLTEDVEEDAVFDSVSELQFVGRIVLNLWRLMRHEAALTSYTFENVTYHILRKRVPHFSFRTLTNWFSSATSGERWRVFDHYISRVKGSMDLILHLDLIGRTSELARLFGIQFFEVLSRGSQFRVESMMLRLAHCFNYVAISPSIQQRSRMRAPEVIALVMEPESQFYSSPVLVLDFQSLYPSIIIAYNYCFSTCVGRVEHLEKNDPFEFGCASLNIPLEQLKLLAEFVTISPVGVAYVKPSVRRGILPKMLQEILDTRIMVKTSMKKCKDNKSLQRILDARQLGLKLIANVTYGYTAANFSGRMPCVEVADSIVSKARETLERAIALVSERKEWNARVVYGDTDSLFVHLPGQTKETAFRIGQEIADAVTNDNPKPIKLKFEKVYMPCVLQTKKRYVGYMYETIGQKDPTFDAKGIETIRRDGCPALVKTLEKSLKILFNTRDISQVKNYVQRQFQKFLTGNISIQDCIFAREYRGRSGYKPAACVPALEIAKKLTRKDPRAEPRCGERVPFVIVYGCPGEPLFHLVRQPEEVLLDSTLRINAHYYINNVLTSPLQRVFGLMGIHVNSWYHTLSRTPLYQLHCVADNSLSKKGTISQYFNSCNCPVCLKTTARGGLCVDCHANPQKTVLVLNQQVNDAERSYHNLKQICWTCTGVQEPSLTCTSLDCPNLYSMVEKANNLQQALHLRKFCHSASMEF